MKRTAALLLVVFAASLAGADDKKKENSPEGEWSLDSQTLKIGKGRLVWKTQTTDTQTVTIHADYSTTKDSLLYAVVTKMDYGTAQKLKDKLPDVDDTFCFRFRVDDDELSIRDVKGKGFEELKKAAGRYKQTQAWGRAKETYAAALTAYDKAVQDLEKAEADLKVVEDVAKGKKDKDRKDVDEGVAEAKKKADDAKREADAKKKALDKARKEYQDLWKH
jgi:hypothetical protein